jgi:hypothetical protein
MFDMFFMQADIFSAAAGLVVALATLLSAASGIIVYALNRKQSVNKGELSARDERIRETAKAALLGGQKTVENIGEIRQVAQALYDLLGPEQKRYLDEKVAPILMDSTKRLEIGNQQIERVNGILVSLMGDKANVNNDPNIPREPKELSQKLRSTTL